MRELTDEILKLKELADKQDWEGFEVARAAIIERFLQSLPADKQVKARALQARLDEQRQNLDRADFMQLLLNQLNENLQNIDDQLSYLRHKLHGQSF